MAYYYRDSKENCEYVDLWYELQNGDKTVYVTETYRATTYEKPNAVPTQIKLVGKEVDLYYCANLYDFIAHPTEDWLLSFGLKPYVEQEWPQESRSFASFPYLFSGAPRVFITLGVAILYKTNFSLSSCLLTA